MSKVLPILFNTDMVQAILDDRKTTTRRCLKPQPIHKDLLWIIEGTGWSDNISVIRPVPGHSLWNRMPYHLGDILYVRETWRVGAWDIRNRMIAFDYKDGTCGELVYIHSRELFNRLVDQSREDARNAKCEYNGADYVWEKGKSPCRWHPSIHMPKKAARIWLRVTDVRVERLQNMWASDVPKEGIYFTKPHTADEMLMEFSKLWNSTIPKKQKKIYEWDANPWVWVIEFERCEKPESEADISRHIEECSLQKKYGEAGRDGNGACLGFGKSFDDEPIEQCKQCIAYTGLESEEK